MSIIDKLAKKVQDSSGETERRELVEEMKDTHDRHVRNIQSKVELLNKSIALYNRVIHNINDVRNRKISKRLSSLHQFLNQFGQLKPRETYQAEHEKQSFHLPQQAFVEAEQYIGDIDWSKDFVFKQSFKKGFFGTKKENRKSNLTIIGKIGEYKITADAQLDYLRIENETVQLQEEVANIYVSTITGIDGVIEAKIMPELELAHAFLEAEEVKNHLISNRNIPQVLEKTDVSLLQNTRYHHHYQFVKNTFLFYVLSEKVYSTPILTNLMNQSATKEDYFLLKGQAQELAIQGDKLTNIEENDNRGSNL
ncbi:hypothetical protein [Sporosarcina sp. OR05]|uniref:hypothetical protein n=1 Tax=Sporosarcina sp. OR05 TaxID=2969819 RepID=UPI00352B8F99